MVNLDSILKTSSSFPSPPYTTTGFGNDPVWSDCVRFADLCASSSTTTGNGFDVLFEQSTPLKCEPPATVAEEPISFDENVVEVETTTTNGIEGANMNTITNNLEPPQQPNIAFRPNGLLAVAPAAPTRPMSNLGQTMAAANSRLVKFTATSKPGIMMGYYSPPPTPNTPTSTTYDDDGANRRDSSNNTRGAVYARQYRQKNREHVEQLEAQNRKLFEQNEQIRKAYEQTRDQNDKLNREVAYLREVLQNQSAIASILKAVNCNAPGLKLQFPVSSSTSNGGGDPQQQQESAGARRSIIETRAGAKRKLDGQQQQHNNESKKQRAGGDGNDGSGGAGAGGTGPGVCLHVNGDTVSVEFCSRCNREARHCKSLQTLEELLTNLLSRIYERIEM